MVVTAFKVRITTGYNTGTGKRNDYLVTRNNGCAGNHCLVVSGLTASDPVHLTSLRVEGMNHAPLVTKHQRTHTIYCGVGH